MTQTTSVPFLDLRAAYLELKLEIDGAIAEVLASGHLILGPVVERFESEFATYVGARHCVGVGNGLDALVLALKALGIGPGDEVLVPSNTFIATWLAVSHVGATPVPVEPSESTFIIDTTAAERCITAKTRAIIPVHLYGIPVDLAPFRELARRNKLILLDDAAQAHGAAVAGQRVGGQGSSASTWSFYPGKNLGGLGDGGAITTDDSGLAERLRKLRNYGSSVKYVHDLLGWNSRLDPIQAAVLSVKLRHLDAWNTRRQTVADQYIGRLRGLPGLALPTRLENGVHAWHLFVVRAHRRDMLRKELALMGVQTLIHYPIAPHRQEAYRATAVSTPLPVADRLQEQVLSLPMGPHLTDDQQDHVVAAVRAVLEKIS